MANLLSLSVSKKSVSAFLGSQLGEENVFATVRNLADKNEKKRIAKAQDRADFNASLNSQIEQSDLTFKTDADRYVFCQNLAGNLKRQERNADAGAARERASRRRAKEKAARKAAGIELSQEERNAIDGLRTRHENKVLEIGEIVKSGFRSDAHAQLKRIVEFTRLQMLAGPSPDNLRLYNRPDKPLALNQDYIVLNDVFRGSITIPLVSPHTSRQDLLNAVMLTGLPAPSIVSNLEDANGNLIGVNLTFQFPPVSFSERSSKKAQAAYYACLNGLRKVLKPIGADLRADPNLILNPLSPGVCCEITGPIYSLTELLKFLPRHVSVASLHGSDVRAADYVAGIKAGLYSFGTASFRIACSLVPEFWTVEKDKLPAFKAKLAVIMRTLGKATKQQDDFVERAIIRISEQVWAKHDPSIRRKWKVSGVGVCRDLVIGMTLIERFRIGAFYSARLKHDRSYNAVVDAIESLHSKGFTKATASMIRAEMSKERRLSERQIYRYLALIRKAIDDALAAKHQAMLDRKKAKAERLKAAKEAEAFIVVDRHAKYLKHNDDIRAGKIARTVIDRFPREGIGIAA